MFQEIAMFQIASAHMQCHGKLTSSAESACAIMRRAFLTFPSTCFDLVGFCSWLIGCRVQARASSTKAWLNCDSVEVAEWMAAGEVRWGCVLRSFLHSWCFRFSDIQVCIGRLSWDEHEIVASSKLKVSMKDSSRVANATGEALTTTTTTTATKEHGQSLHCL